MTIGTKLHRAIAICPKDEADGSAYKTLTTMLTMPNFVINEELRSLFEGLKLQSSVEAMFEAGRALMPYPMLMLEMWGGMDFRYFVVIHQDPENQSHFILGIVEYLEHSIYLPDHREQVVDSLMAIDLEFNPQLPDNSGPGWSVKMADRKDLDRQDIVHHAIAAVNIALVMSHMNTLEREVIDPVKLNKARLKSGKPSINRHIIVRIGHVYDRSGNKIRVTDSNRRTMSIHMRAGHTRRQPHGERWMIEHPDEAKLPNNTNEYHYVWIEPVLINFKDGTDLPVPKPRIVKL